MLQRRQWLAAALAAGCAPEVLALGLPQEFAPGAPELLPLLGLNGEGLDPATPVIEGRLPPVCVGATSATVRA